MTLTNNILITSKGKENITNLGSLIHWHYAEAIKYSLNSLYWINLSNDNIGTKTLGTHSTALAAPAITSDNNGFTGNYKISGTHDALPSGLASTITVIKEVLTISIIGSHHRELQLASGFQCLVTKNASGGFLGTANNLWQQLTAVIVETINQIATIIHNDIRLSVQCHINILVVFLHGAAVMSQYSYAFLNQSSTYIILSG